MVAIALLLDPTSGGPATGDNPFPVRAASTDTALGQIFAALPGFGVAGTPSDDVLTVQGHAGGTPVSVTAASLPLPSGAATEATLAAAKTALDTVNTNLVAVNNSIKGSVNLTETLWTDGSLFYVRRTTVNQGTGAISEAFTDVLGNPASPSAGSLRPAANESSLSIVQSLFDVTNTNGPGGYSIGNILAHLAVLNQNSNPPTVAANVWLNLSTGAIISAPTAGDYVEVTRNVAVTSSALPAGAATEATLAAVNTKLAGTVAVSAAALPLPAGAATAAKQPALGVAGTPSSDVLTVQGKAGMTALVVDGSGVTQPVSGTVSLSGSLPGFAATPTVNAVQSGAWLTGVKGADGATVASSANPVPVVVSDGASVNASVTGTGAILTFNTAGFGYIEFQFPSVGAGSTVVVKASADGGATKNPVAFWRQDSVTAAPVVSVSPLATHVFVVPVLAPLMTIECSAYGSGTLSCYAAMKLGACPQPQTVSMSGSVTINGVGGWTDGSTNNTAGLQIGGYDGAVFRRLKTDSLGQSLVRIADASGSLMGFNGNGSGDAIANAHGVELQAATFGRVFNGTTWDRAYSLSALNATSAIGVQAVGPVGQFNSTLPTLTTGQYGGLQLGSRGYLLSSVAKGSSLGDGRPASGAQFLDQDGSAYHLYTIGYGFNGTTVDRLRTLQGIDTTGLGVQAVGPLGQYKSTTPTLTDGQFNPLMLGTRGSLKVQLMAPDGGSQVTINTPADATANATVQGYFAVAAPLLFNGTAWDRQKATVAGLNSTGTGIAAVGLVAQLDDTSPTAITEDQFGNLRMSSDRGLLTAVIDGAGVTRARKGDANGAYGVIRDAAGNARGANVTAANALVVDGSAVTQPVSAAALPLPAGAATAAHQVTIEGKLDTIHADGAAVSGVVTMTPDLATTAGRGIQIICTVAGNVSLTFGDASVQVIPVAVGLTRLPDAITTLNSSGTTATVTCQVLK